MLHAVFVFCSSAVMLFRSGEGFPQHIPQRDNPHGHLPGSDLLRTGGDNWSGRRLDLAPPGDKNGDNTAALETVQSPYENGPCYGRSNDHEDILDDIFAVVGQGGGSGTGQRTKAFTRLGDCATGSLSTVLSQLSSAEHSEERNQLDVLQPNIELLDVEEGQGRLVLILNLSQPPILKLKSILLLAFRSPLMIKDLSIIISSEALHPNIQTVCLSEGTQYFLLTGKALVQSHGQKKLNLSLETTTGQNLKDIFYMGGSESNISMTPLLLFWPDRGTDTRRVYSSSPESSETFMFLCELQRFLAAVLPQNGPRSTPVQLESLQSLPRLQLGTSTSQGLLAGLLNSSAPTLFSFPTQASILRLYRGELALPPALSEILRQRLQQTLVQVTEVITEEDVGHRAMKRLARIKTLSGFPKQEPATGESQYCAFLLLKALQTVASAYETERGLRDTRAGQQGPVRGDICRLHSLTVSLQKYYVDPDTATINNCHGTCGFPLFNGNNHAMLLNTQIQSGMTLERALCCVPVAYDELEVVELSDDGTFLSIKPNMVAKECGCR